MKLRPNQKLVSILVAIQIYVMVMLTVSSYYPFAAIGMAFLMVLYAYKQDHDLRRNMDMQEVVDKLKG